MDTIPIHNRVYLTIDTVKGVLLNNHVVSEDKIIDAFDFVINNPKKLKHLPTSLEEAIVLVDVTQLISRDFYQYNIINTKKIKTGKFKNKQELISKVIMTPFIKKILKTNQNQPKSLTIESLTEEQVIRLEEYLDNQIAFGVDNSPMENKGIKVKLPPWSDLPPPIQELKERNVLFVLVNAKNELLVEHEPTVIAELKDQAKEFIANPSNNPSLAESPKQAIISLKNERGTDYYEIYLTVYNELKAAYGELWEEMAQAKFGLPYDQLDNQFKKEIRAEIPLVISEAESAFGEE